MSDSKELNYCATRVSRHLPAKILVAVICVALLVAFAPDCVKRIEGRDFATIQFSGITLLDNRDDNFSIQSNGNNIFSIEYRHIRASAVLAAVVCWTAAMVFAIWRSKANGIVLPPPQVQTPTSNIPADDGPKPAFDKHGTRPL